MPTSTQLKPYILQALSTLGGAADNDEMANLVASSAGLAPEALKRLHDPARGKRTEFGYRLAWAKSKLKAEGLIERAGSRRWTLTEAGRAGQTEGKPASS